MIAETRFAAEDAAEAVELFRLSYERVKVRAAVRAGSAEGDS